MSDDREALIQEEEGISTAGTGYKFDNPGFAAKYFGTRKSAADFEPPMIFESVQKFPSYLAGRMPQWLCYVLGFATILLWMLLMVLISQHSLFAYPVIDGDQLVHSIPCHADLSFWAGPNSACGLNAERCLGSKADVIYKFRCPSNCVRESWTYTPTPVGTKVAYHQTFVVGSQNAYRADSSICGAALHQGIISDRHGGCGVLRVGKSPAKFHGEIGNNTIKSFEFDSPFVSSYEFLPTEQCTGCSSKSTVIMWVNFFVTLLFAYFVSDPLCFLLGMATIGFWTVILAANPPWTGGSPENNAEIISRGLGRYLPCFFGVIFIYHVTTKFQLAKLQANLSRAVLWGVPFYLGILENFTFGYIPVDRLIVSDLDGQAGAWTAFIIIAVIVLLIVIRQAYVIWLQGYFVPYICLYLGMGLGLGILGSIPNVTLRIHHYILALLFLPGTYPRTGLSMVYQGLLVGLFVAGASRWGFDPIVQTYEQLRRGGPIEHGGTAYFLEPHVSAVQELSSVVLRWAETATEPLLDGYSLIINDVERWRGAATAFNLTSWALDTFGPNLPGNIYYVRIAAAALSSDLTGGYTRAGIVDLASGKWTKPEAGQV